MFAKKTGDYGSLSHVDMKLMALTYQLECELGPEKGANLRKEPQRTVSTTYHSQYLGTTQLCISGPLLFGGVAHSSEVLIHLFLLHVLDTLLLQLKHYSCG